MSTTTAPSESASAIPSPSTASWTTRPSGSMVITALAVANALASRADAAPV